MQTNLSESVALDIRNKILDRTYPPNSQLPNEYDLAEQYGVCRYTIREAIKKLVAIGLVTVERGKGTFVNEAVISSYFNPIIERLVLLEKDVNEIFEARLAIEVKTSALAAQNATENEVKQMRDLVKQMEEALEKDDLKQHNTLDLKFHENIALAGKNRILIEILRILYDMITYALERVPVKREKYVHSMNGHYRLLEAIENKQPELASEIMYDHLNFCRQLASGKQVS